MAIPSISSSGRVRRQLRMPRHTFTRCTAVYSRLQDCWKRECGSHDFRHTYAVELLKAGVDIRKVSKALGHSSIQVTERFYSKWNRAQQGILDADLEKALNHSTSDKAVSANG